MVRFSTYCIAAFLLPTILITSISMPVQAQTNNAVQSQNRSRTISGRITDEKGALAGVTVMIRATGRGTATDAEGRYSIGAPADGNVVLTFSYIGMKTQTITVTPQQKTLNVKMLPDANQIQDVVVQGAYGTVQKRSDLVGSAYQIAADKIENLPMDRVDRILDGLAPGVLVEPNTDSPGSPRTRYNVRVRGDASLSASNEPLWVVDGMPIYTGGNTNNIPMMSYSVSPLSMLNPGDIESITILKDAVSTSIYGADGANGVILVTTKKGAKGSMNVTAQMRYGVSVLDKSTMLRILDGPKFLEYSKEAWLNSGQLMENYPFQDNANNTYSTTNTKWSDLYLDTGSTREASITISGGSNRLTSYTSASYFDETGTTMGNRQQRFSLRNNTRFDLNRWLKGGVIMYGSYNVNKLFSLGSQYYKDLPIYSPYNNDGSYRLYNTIWKQVTNNDTTDPNYPASGNGEKVTYWTFANQKYYANDIPSREDNDDTQRTLATNLNAHLTLTPFKGLEITSHVGADFHYANEYVYATRSNWDGLNIDTPELSGYSTRNASTTMVLDNVNRINFNRSIGKFNVGAVAGLEFKHKETRNLQAKGNGFYNDHIQEIAYATADTKKGYSSQDHSRQMSYFVKGDISFDRRYYISSSYRSDGFSGFSRYSRWTGYWSSGASWNVNNEKWFKSRVISTLKLKATVGTNGNSRVSSYPNGTVSTSASDGYAGLIGATIGTPMNTGLSWEKTLMTNVGARITLWDRFDIEVEAYKNRTDDLISSIYVSRAVGDAKISSNVGKLQNKGIELTLSSVNMARKDFEWRTELLLSHNKNKILETYEGMYTGFFTTVWMPGYDKDSFWLVEWAGVDPLDGGPLWYDIDGNITKTFSYSNRRISGKTSQPTVSGSLMNNFKWGSFSLGIQLRYSIGGYELSSFGGLLDDGNDAIADNTIVEALDHWSKPGDLSVNPRISANNNSLSSMGSTRFLYPKTFFRLQNVALSYQLPKKVCQKLDMQSASVTLIGNDLALWTPGMSRTRNSYKTMMTAYPMANVYSINISLTF